MNAIPADSGLDGLVRIDASWGRRIDADAGDDDPRPFALQCLPREMRDEILDRCVARDITRLACVSVSMWTALQRHPVVLAFVQIGLPCGYAGLVDGLNAIQASSLRHRASLMRDYACRMQPIDDGDAAMPWRKHLGLCKAQLTSAGDASVMRAGYRELDIAEPIALLRILPLPLRQTDMTVSRELQLEVLPAHYVADVWHSLLGVNVGATASFAWRAALRVRWQVQPILLTTLIFRIGLARVDVEQWWGVRGHLVRWEQNIVTASLTQDRPRLAIRTLTIAYHLSRLDRHGERAVILQRALTIAREKTPPWSWNELIELLCLHHVRSAWAGAADWPRHADIAQWLTDFLSDRATVMVSPSSSFVATLIDHAAAIWPCLPDGVDGDESRYDRLCETLDLRQKDRNDLRDALKRDVACDVSATREGGTAASGTKRAAAMSETPVSAQSTPPSHRSSDVSTEVGK